jgi:putative acetyltransferase
MAASAATAGKLSVAAEDPRGADGRALVAEMSAYIEIIYPEDAEYGIYPTTPEMLAEGAFLIARLDGAAVGMGALMPHDKVDGLSVMEVKRMFVRPEARGRRVADVILRELEAIAANRGLDKLVLLCGPRQPDALRLYSRNFYSVRGPFGAYSENPLSIFMEKSLLGAKP